MRIMPSRRQPTAMPTIAAIGRPLWGEVAGVDEVEFTEGMVIMRCAASGSKFVCER